MTEPRRQEYMQDLIEYYIEPIIKEEARREKRRLSAAINAAMNETISVFDHQQAINEVETNIDEEEKNELETNEEIIGDTPTLPTSNDLDLTEFIEVSPMTPTANTPFGEDSLEKIVTKDTKNAEANDITYEITEEDIIADLIASDKRGELSPEAQIEYADLLAKGYASEAATESVDEWDDINAIDDLIVSDINRDDEWAIRDEMASQHQRDVDQSQLKTRRQFASVEAQRAEKRRVEEEKRRKRAADMAAISAGLGQIANQIRQAEQQSSFETQQRQVRIDQNASSYKNSAAERNKFINSCLDSIQNTSTGFRANDPHANRIACSEKFNAHKNATTGNGQTYLERLEVQRRSGQQNYSTRPNARQVSSQSQLKAKADCSCYEAGKEAGAFSKNSKTQIERPSECAPMHGMGNLPPWRSGFYDGRDNSETHSKDDYGRKWCRLGN